tara:strand:+ start:656 stop:826 length:171 start_codon:yes stop_codon:yes gene_type:complete
LDLKRNRVITVELSLEQIAWLDEQSANLSVSRAAYLRTILQLLLLDQPLTGLIKKN